MGSGKCGNQLMTRDHNLLFGVFAVQLGKVRPDTLMKAAAAWAVEPSKALPEQLVDANAISPSDRDLIRRLVDEAVAAHGGDVAKTLDNFGGEEQVHHTYRGSIVLTADGQVSIPPTARTPESHAPDTQPGDVSTVKGVFETPGRYTNSIEHTRGGTPKCTVPSFAGTVSIPSAPTN